MFPWTPKPPLTTNEPVEVLAEVVATALNIATILLDNFPPVCIITFFPIVSLPIVIFPPFARRKTSKGALTDTEESL